MIAFIDAYRNRFGVEPICRTLQFAPFHLLVSEAPAAVEAF